MVFVGNKNPPMGTWPEKPFTTVPKTPAVREKPYLFCSGDTYEIRVSPLNNDTIGTTWFMNKDRCRKILMNECFIAIAGTLTATAKVLNAKLNDKKNLILTPSIYHLDEPLIVNTRILSSWVLECPH